MLRPSVRWLTPGIRCSDTEPSPVPSAPSRTALWTCSWWGADLALAPLRSHPGSKSEHKNQTFKRLEQNSRISSLPPEETLLFLISIGCSYCESRLYKQRRVCAAHPAPAGDLLPLHQAGPRCDVALQPWYRLLTPQCHRLHAGHMFPLLQVNPYGDRERCAHT